MSKFYRISKWHTAWRVKRRYFWGRGNGAGGGEGGGRLFNLYNDDESHALLQIDASNAFNSINRAVTMHNIKVLCPEFATYVINCYVRPARLFITGGKELASDEGTTQGDPVAMGMYAIGILPLLLFNMPTTEDERSKCIAFADDFTGIGKLHHLKDWWESICTHGSHISYFSKPSKSWLIAKEQYYEDALKLFEDSSIQITTEGNRHLGAVLGSDQHKNKYVSDTVNSWIEQVNNLSKFAECYPHAAYSAFVFGLQHRYRYAMRTIPDIANDLQPLEDSVL